MVISLVARSLAAFGLAVTLSFTISFIAHVDARRNLALGKAELMVNAERRIELDLETAQDPPIKSLFVGIFVALFVVGFLTVFELLSRLFEFLGKELAVRMRPTVAGALVSGESGGPTPQFPELRA